EDRKALLWRYLGKSSPSTLPRRKVFVHKALGSLPHTWARKSADAGPKHFGTASADGVWWLSKAHAYQLRPPRTGLVGHSRLVTGRADPSVSVRSRRVIRAPGAVEDAEAGSLVRTASAGGVDGSRRCGMLDGREPARPDTRRLVTWPGLL